MNILSLLIGSALALSYFPIDLPYIDQDPEDRETNVALSVLTEADVIRGNPDATFRPDANLNRAEFMVIAMRLIPDEGELVTLPCFPDVATDLWYSFAVCRAKARGIVEGNREYGVPPELWNFVPERDVSYAEALKVLTEVIQFSGSPLPSPLPTGEGMVWYEPYLTFANEQKIGLNVGIGHFLKRSEMARLTAAYLAWSRGELELLRTAQGEEAEDLEELEEVEESSSSASSVSSEGVRSLPTPPADQGDQTPPKVYDTNPDVSLSPGFILLGQDSPVLASVNVFSEAESLAVTDIKVTLASEVNSVEQILVYDDAAAFIGVATRNSTSPTEYDLGLKTSDIVIPMDRDRSFYVRARVKHFDAGGISGQNVRVSSITIEGDGVWSSNSYSKASTDSFSTFETARSVITSITNPTSSTDVFVSGNDRVIGSYRFEGRTGDTRADLSLTDLSFQIEQQGGVTLSNVSLVNALDTSSLHSCTVVGSSTVNCNSLPESFGTFEDGPLTIRLVGDVTDPGAVDPSLRLSLNRPGAIGSAGSITWTDGTESFEWVPFNQPVVRGTYFD